MNWFYLLLLIGVVGALVSVLAFACSYCSGNQSLASLQQAAIYFYDGDRLVQEVNPSFEWLQWLYQRPLGRLLRQTINRRWACQLAGWYYDSSLSRRSIKPFIDRYKISLDDYQVPVGGYSSFNDFFIRKLKPKARAIAPGPMTVVSPVDGKVYAIANLAADSTFFVKQKPFKLGQFLGSEALACDYANGLLLIFRLAPSDYHRIHFPFDCTPSAPTSISGRFESVNPLVFKQGLQPLLENERHLIQLQSTQFGRVMMVLVGAMLVGRVVEIYTPERPYRKGEEVGYFAFGGSTVALLFKQGTITPKEVFLENSLHGYETAIKMGGAVN